MSAIQRVVTTALFPFAASIERESREWRAVCPCGHARSIWELGGVRWLARGEPRRRLTCPACGERTWHRIQRG
jgi:hypothetical protein